MERGRSLEARSRAASRPAGGRAAVLVPMLLAALCASSAGPHAGTADIPNRFDATDAAQARRRLGSLPAASRLFREGRYDEAGEAFQAALDSLPRVSEGATGAALIGLPGAVELERLRGRIEDGLGLCHFRARRFDEALVHLRRAAEADPAAARPLVHQGLALMHQKRYVEARDAFERARARGAGGAKLLLDLGRVLAKGGEPSRARAVLVRGLREGARAGDVQSWGTALEAQKLLAEIDREQNRLKEAERRLRGVLARSPGDPEARYRLSQVLARRGRTAEARRELQRSRRDAETLGAVQTVLAQEPGGVEALWWVADTYRKLGLLHLADVHYRQLVARNPRDAKARLARHGLRVRVQAMNEGES